MINQKENLMKLLLSITLLICSILTLQGQDATNDATKNKRVATTAGGWYTGGINTSLISVGQNGVSTLLTVTAGQTEYRGNFGFVLPLVEEIEPNEAPIAITSTLSIFFEEDEILGLDGFDPDGDEIRFEIVGQPKLVTLTPDNQLPGEYFFTPKPELTPGIGYKDTIRFKVIEVEGEKLQSDVAIFPFTFNVEDQEHIISSFSYSDDSETTRSFELVLTDNRFNSDYQVLMTYLPLQVEESDGSIVLADVNYLLANLTKENNTLKAVITADKNQHPLLFTTQNVLIDIDVTTTTGFNDYDAFLLENKPSGSGGGGNGNFDVGNNNQDGEGGDDKIILESLASNDGLFIGFNKKKKTPEKTPVQVKMTAVELGGFDLADVELAITANPKQGTLSKPVLVKKENKLVQWTALYTPLGINGYEDTFDYTLLSKSRQESITNTASIEVINVNDPPTLNAIPGQKIDEEQTTTVDLNFSDVDSELEVLAISSDPSKVAVSINGNKLTAVPAPNFNGKVNIKVTVQEKNTAEKYTKFETFDLEVAPVNDAPVLAAISNQTVNEDNTFTYNLSATDVDAKVPVFGFSAIPDVQGVAEVTINGNLLTVKPKANYNGTVNFTVTADDRLGTATSLSQPKSFSLVIAPVNDAPVSTATIPSQTMLDVLPAYVLDMGQYFDDIETADANLTITNNATGNLFTLSTSGDKITVSPKQGQSGTENVTFTVSDGELSVTQTVAFTVQSNSNSITSRTIQPVTLNEDFATYTIDLSGVFTDTGDPNAVFNYTVGGLSNLKGTITGNQMQLTTTKDFNGSETVFLIGSANGKSSFTTFGITVNPVNDAPSLGIVGATSIQEDTELNNVFMTFTDIDTDFNNLTFTATSSNEGLLKSSDIKIVKTSSGILLSGTPVSNANGESEITVSVSDGEFSSNRKFKVNVLSVNDAPIALSSTIAGATEDASYTQALAGLFSDVDGDKLTFTIEDHPSWLSVSNGNLVGTPKNENVGTKSFIVVANDGSRGTTRQQFSINVVNTNDAPVVANPAADITAAEDVLLSSRLASNIFLDVDNDALTLSASFTGASWLSFDASTRRFIGTPTNADVGTVNITLTATDPSGASVSDNLVLTVTNVNDTPTDLTISSLSIPENSSVGTAIGALSTSDEDTGDSFTYTLVTGTGAENNSLFNIVGGQLVSNGNIDYEATPSLSVRLKTTDAAGASFEKPFTITVTNVNEAPTALASSSLIIAENSGANAEIGTLSSTDPDNGDTFTYTLVAGTGDTDNASFDISNGKLVAKNSLNFESKSSYSVRVKTQDAGGLTFEDALAITVTNVNEAPTEISLDATAIDENVAIGTLVGNLSSTDEDAGDTFTYTLASGTNDNGSFGIDGSKLITATEIDFETKASYTVVVTTTDAGGASFDKTFAVNVNNVVEASMAEIPGLVFEITDIEETSSQSFTIQNTGDLDIEIASITLPEGYTANKSAFTVAIGASTEVEVTFSPSEAKSYVGEMVIQSNVGETKVNITGEGTIITAVDDDIIDSSEIGLYPNPAQHLITIDLSKIPQLQPNLAIVDLNGNSLWQREKVKESKVEVNVSGFPAGTYLIRVATENSSIIKKLIIVK